MKFDRTKTLFISLLAATLMSVATVQAETISDLNIELDFEQIALPDFWEVATFDMSLPVMSIPTMPGTAIGYRTQTLHQEQTNWRRTRGSQPNASTETLTQG